MDNRLGNSIDVHLKKIAQAISDRTALNILNPNLPKLVVEIDPVPIRNRETALNITPQSWGFLTDENGATRQLQLTVEFVVRGHGTGEFFRAEALQADLQAVLALRKPFFVEWVEGFPKGAMVEAIFGEAGAFFSASQFYGNGQNYADSGDEPQSGYVYNHVFMGKITFGDWLHDSLLLNPEGYDIAPEGIMGTAALHDCDEC
jgi:hypothetical protein